MIGNPTTIVGIPLRWHAPLFFDAAGLTAVIAGAIAMMMSRKGGPLSSSRNGYWGLAGVFVTMSALAFCLGFCLSLRR